MTGWEKNVRQKCWAVQKGVRKGSLKVYNPGYSNAKQQHQ